MAEDRKKYKNLENGLQTINKKFITVSEADKKMFNQILNSVLDCIIKKMKENSPLFAAMYKKLFYGGSYYDNLKVSSPDEFDLDLLLQLPEALKIKLAPASNLPGFVHLKISDFTPSMEKLELEGKYKGFSKLTNTNHYLDTANVLHWFQGVLQLALNTLNKDSLGRYIVPIPQGNLYAKISKSGPAFTLKTTCVIKGKEINMDVDLVPCFLFDEKHWPQEGFRRNPASSTKGKKSTFFIVPKPLPDSSNNQYWRLSFQEQERILLDGKQNLKPTIRLLKKMRDLLQHKKIASYYIKTVALWTIDDTKDLNFWNYPLSYVFMTILKNYQKHLESEKIPYYWNKNFNLLNKVNKITLTNISYKLKTVINDIDKNLNDPLVVAKYLLTQEELLVFQTQCSLKI